MKYSQTIINNYLIKQLPTAAVFLNTKFEVVHASDKWINDFDLSDDIIGKSIYQLFQTVGKEWQEILESCMLGEGREKGRARFLDDVGNERWFERIHLPWYDEKENIIGIIIQTEDITEQVEREQDYEKLKLLLKEKSDIARIGSWEYDPKSDELEWCEMTRMIHEVSDDFVPDINTGINFYNEGYSRNTISMAVYRAMENKDSWCEKLEIVTANGNEKWVISAGKPLFKNGEFVGLIGTFQDITDIVLSELKTRESELLLRTVIDNLPLNVYIKDLESRKILVNRSECEYLGVSDPQELLGKSDFDLYDPEIAQISRDEDLYVMNTNSPILGRETINIKTDGSATSFLISKIPLNGEDGKPYGLVGISLDISNLKQQEADLRDLINVTSLQNKKLVNFAHIVSHNLRSHTANFSMLLDFLIREKDETEKLNIIKMLTRASDNLLETLENLNEVVAISTNTNMEKKSVNLVDKIASVQQNLTAFLQTNRAKLLIDIPPGTTIKAVPAYVDSILLNFITNAVRYKDPERDPVIKLSVEQKDHYTILGIEDNGMGIDLKKYGDKLFGMYKTFHNNPDARGIGLYITKNQIEAMNGKVTTSSKVGKGTTFKIYFNEKN